MSHDDIVKKFQGNKEFQDITEKMKGITQEETNAAPPPKEKEDPVDAQYKAKELEVDLEKEIKEIGKGMEKEGVTPSPNNAQEIVAEYGQIKPTETPQPAKEKEGMQR